MHRTVVQQTRRPSIPPAGTRPPAPPWLKIGAWLLLVSCLSLALLRTPMLTWATQQPLLVVADLTSTSRERTAGPQGLDRLHAVGALLLRGVLLPPGYFVVQGVGVIGLSLIALECMLGAVLLVTQALQMRRQGSTILRVRVPTPAAGRGTTESGADLFRALHRHIPTTGVALGQAPWLALTLGGQPDAPTELGLVLSGGTPTQRRSWVAQVGKTIQGLAPDALIDTQPDAFAVACQPGRCVVWRTWRLALPPDAPLQRSVDRQASDLLGPLVAALPPRPGVAATEFQLVLQPRRDDIHLARSWRAAATRRLLRLKQRSDYALPPDAPALEAKLHGPVYHTTIRAVAVSTTAQAAAALAELDEVEAVLGQYAARSGSRLQYWVPAEHGMLQVPAPVSPAGARLRIALTLVTLIGAALLGPLLIAPLESLIWPRAGFWHVLTIPQPLRQLLPLALARLLPCALTLILLMCIWRWHGHHQHAPLTALLRRVPRAVPPPGCLLGAAWRGPAILGPDELAGLWHLPTAALGRLVRWLPCRYLPPPPHAFLAPTETGQHGAPTRLIIGTARHQHGDPAPVGIPLRDARQGIAFTAPPGVGKTQLAANLADQLRPCGYTLIDGKGDDAGNLVETMRRRIPLADEARLVVLDVCDTDWPIGLNPLAGVDRSDTGAIDQVLGQIEAIFARLDPDTWAKAPRMKNYLRKATLLVLAGEAHPTIAHVKQALLDEHYRQRLLPHCQNVEVVDFWTVEFPQIGEPQRASRDALVSRFDMLLDSELTRYLFNQTIPALTFHDAIAERLMVLAPLPHRMLGGLAGPVGMLLFQALLRAAFRRPGSDLTRAEYGFIGDEFQVLVENCDTKDVRDALTQVRAFGIVTIIANQLHAQLGDLAAYELTAISNRILLRTQEPDATLYARHYAASGITAADVSGQEPRAHQYAWIGVHGALTHLFSMCPLPWPPPLVVQVPPHAGPAWQTVLPPASPTPAFDAQILALVYAAHAEPQRLAQALATASDEQWAMLITRWDAIRVYQRNVILAAPGAIPDTATRQVWLSRLRAARPRVLAQAEYARIRQALHPTTGAPGRRAAVVMRGDEQPERVGAPQPVDLPPTHQPHHLELEQRVPQRLARIEPNDLQVDAAEHG